MYSVTISRRKMRYNILSIRKQTILTLCAVATLQYSKAIATTGRSSLCCFSSQPNTGFLRVTRFAIPCRRIICLSMNMSPLDSSAPAVPSEQQQQQQLKILCYGDSLTAGTSPPRDELYPYGLHLEQSLRKQISATSTNAMPLSPLMVRWLGLPGWTATSMVESIDAPNGLRSLLRSVRNKTGSVPTLCIILAGTNDLAYQVEARPIVAALEGLHQSCHEEGVATVAVAIPPSAWQAKNTDAAKLASDVNQGLKRFCEQQPNSMATFALNPIEMFDTASRGNGPTLWSPDGLHFSPDGFQALGEGLAQDVMKALSQINKGTI